MKKFKFNGIDGSIDQNLNLEIKLGSQILKNNKELKYKEAMKNGDVISVPDNVAIQLQSNGLYEEIYAKEIKVNKKVKNNKKVELNDSTK